MGGQSTTAYSTSSSCPSSGCFYLDIDNCQSSTYDWAGFANIISCDAGTTFCNVDYDGCILMCMMCDMGPSDVRLKQSIETLKDSLSNIMMLEVVEYDWNKNLSKGEYDFFERNKKLHSIGLIAQNVREYYPEIVKLNDHGYYHIDYTKLNSVLVEGIKEQQVFIEEIDKELDFIESKLN